MKQYKKPMVRLKEDNDRNYAADISGKNDTASQIINKTKQEHSDADSVTIPSNEVDGNSSTQTSTIEVTNNGSQTDNEIRKMANALKSQGLNANFKVNLNNESKEHRVANLLENSVSFSKREFMKTFNLL